MIVAVQVRHPSGLLVELSPSRGSCAWSGGCLMAAVGVWTYRLLLWSRFPRFVAMLGGWTLVRIIAFTPDGKPPKCNHADGGSAEGHESGDVKTSYDHNIKVGVVGIEL